MKRRYNSGITQLELMISLAILALITLLLSGSLNYNRQSLDRYQEFSEQRDQYVSRRAFKQWATQIPATTGVADVAFEGTSNRLSFQTLVADDQFWGGALTSVELELISQNGTQTLVARVSGLEPENLEQIEVHRILAQDVSKATIRYFGNSTSSGTKDWYSDWSETWFLPALVKVEWEHTNGDVSVPLTLLPGENDRQRYMSLSSLVPPE